MPTPRPTVLVVEDDALIRMAAVEWVESIGYEAVDARNADQAIRILESRMDIVLVFTDVEMPGSMDGIKLSHYIRDRWPPIHLIVASGKTILDQSHLPASAMFFRKPYDGQAIADAISAFLVTPA
jgi:two-component system, response regulator PdtaR